MTPDPPSSTLPPSALFAKGIDDLRQRVSFSLLQADWTEYRQNLEQSANDVTSLQARLLQLYKDDYSAQIQKPPIQGGFLWQGVR